MTVSNVSRAVRQSTTASALLRLAGRRCLVVIAPHPDDEALGCGLLIAAAARRRIPVAVVVLTDGQGSHPGSRRWPPERLGRLRRSELRRGLARLGAQRSLVTFLGWRDGFVREDGRLARLRRVVLAYRPGVVLAASPDDHHEDHRAGWTLSLAVLRGTAIPLVAYDVWSRVEPPTGRQARDCGIARKYWAARAHRSQTSGYIDDDPAGFTFHAELLDQMIREPERFTRR